MQSLFALLTVGLGVGCSSDGKITAYSEPPEVTIQTPPDGATVDQLVSVSMRGLVVDKEFSESLSSLSAQWSVDGEAICAGSYVDDGGNIDCVHTFPTAGDVELALSVTNPDGESATATSSITIAPNGAPTATILLPESTGHYYADQLVGFLASATDSEDLATDLYATWTSDLDGTLDIDEIPSSEGELSGQSLMSQGEHLITLAVEDSTGLVGTDTVVIEVGQDNSAPLCEITAPENNDSFEEGETILFEGLATDVDIDSDDLTVSWTSNVSGELSTAAPTSDGSMTFGVSSLASATHTITLYVEDEVGDSCSDAILVTVGNGPDIEIDLPASDDVKNEGATVTFQATASDPDDSPTDLGITWTSSVDGELSTAGADSSGVTSFNDAGLTVGEHTITARAEDPDGFYATDTVRLTINGLPDDPDVEIDPGDPTSSEALTATILTDSVDPEGGAVTYSYAWRRNTATTAYTSETVPYTATARGETWAVSVTPSDAYGSGTAGTDSVVIGNSAPSVASASISPSSPVEGDTLTCTAGATSDADGDTVGLSYVWTVDGAAASGSGNTLSSSAFEKGDVITCTVTPNDGYEDGTAVTSAEVTVQNSVPALSSVTLSPTTAYESTTLTCTPGSATDADGDTLSYTYDWVVAGSTLGLDTNELDGSWFDKLDSVTCRVTPSDGTTSGTTVESNSVTIANSAPVLASVTLSPTSGTEATTFACAAGATSDDDAVDSVSVTYGWLISGGDIGSSGSSVNGDDFDKGDTVQCYGVPSDGVTNGTTIYSATVTVDNTAPSATSVTISPADPYTTDSLSVTVSGWTDADGDTESYDYQWYVEGTAVSSGGTSATLSYTKFTKHQMVYVEVTPTDGIADGATLSSDEVEILNTAPGAPTVLVSPSDAEPEDNLVCSVTSASYDADGDTISYSYRWWLEGVKSSVTSSTLDSSYTEDGDTWTCQVTPNDGDENGTSGSDSQEVIDATAPNQPLISSIDAYRNENEVDLSGTAEAGSTVTVYMDCTDGTLEYQDVTATSTGTFTAYFTMDRGQDCDFYAYATDEAGNVSVVSNTVSSESCDPYDEYEDDVGYGDTCLDSVDAWAVLDDDGGDLIEITGNIIDTDDVDWYVIDTSQSITSSGTNLFNFEVTLVEGDGDYSFEIFRGSCATADSCDESDGLTDYSYFGQDKGDGSHSIPGDTRYCASGSAFYNTCDDLSGVYYVKVSRISDVIDCNHYSLEITNGVW